MKIKNVILKSLLYFNLFIFILCIACLDSKVVYPFYVGMLISGGYVALFYMANRDRIERWGENYGLWLCSGKYWWWKQIFIKLFYYKKAEERRKWPKEKELYYRLIPDTFCAILMIFISILKNFWGVQFCQRRIIDIQKNIELIRKYKIEGKVKPRALDKIYPQSDQIDKIPPHSQCSNTSNSGETSYCDCYINGACIRKD